MGRANGQAIGTGIGAASAWATTHPPNQRLPIHLNFLPNQRLQSRLNFPKRGGTEKSFFMADCAAIEVQLLFGWARAFEAVANLKNRASIRNGEIVP